MSTNSPEEAHEETEIPWPHQMEEPMAEKHRREPAEKDASAKPESNGDPTAM